jgi:hypothetical protein
VAGSLTRLERSVIVGTVSTLTTFSATRRSRAWRAFSDSRLRTCSSRIDRGVGRGIRRYRHVKAKRLLPGAAKLIASLHALRISTRWSRVCSKGLCATWASVHGADARRERRGVAVHHCFTWSLTERRRSRAAGRPSRASRRVHHGQVARLSSTRGGVISPTSRRRSRLPPIDMIVPVSRGERTRDQV